MDQHNIDRLFREKLDQLEVTPSANAWSQVEKQIRPKKTPVVYWVAASVSLFLISWIVWPDSSTEHLTPIASEVSHPVYQGHPEFVLPVLEESDEDQSSKKQSKQPQNAPASRKNNKPQVQFAVNETPDTQQEVEETLPLAEVESKTMVAEVEVDQPTILEEVKEEVIKPEFRTVKITYIASSTSNEPEGAPKADSTSAFKKFIAFTEKIDPGDMLADIKTAKDNLLNGGFKNKKDKNSL
ncbi:hypothetical protein [Ekhidna sp.]|uniref:hypothetical protein n=1 Tax=Ekhidna sp. TaxID=2608089 RepID=UPI003512D689